MLETIASWFGFFSTLWSPGASGSSPLAGFWWPANAVACGVISIEGLAMLHLSHKRMTRLAFGFVSLGGFTYAIGEIGGEYFVVAPVETLFHWGIVFGLGSMLWKVAKGLESAQGGQWNKVGADAGRKASQYSELTPSRR